MNWQAEALCAQVDPEIWFPEKGKPNRHAIRICLQCPVRVPCAEAGLQEEYGIWGGQTRDTRRQLRKQAPAAATWTPAATKPCGTPAAYRRHLRRGTTPCTECREAEARRQRDTYDKAVRHQRYEANESSGWERTIATRMGHSLEADGGPSYEHRRESILEGGAA